MTTSWGADRATHPEPGGDSGLAVLAALAAEFPRFAIGTCRMPQGLSLIAVRDRDDSRPGLYAVITPDPAEMRRVLLEDENFPPGAGGTPPDGGCAPGGNRPRGGGGVAGTSASPEAADPGG